MSQNQQIQAALEEQGKQNSEFLKVYEVNLKNLCLLKFQKNRWSHFVPVKTVWRI